MAISLISHVAKTASGTSAGINTTGANLLVFGASGTGSVPTLTDSNSNVWLQLVSHVAASNRIATLAIAQLAATVGAGQTFTTSPAPAPSSCIAAFALTTPLLALANARNGATSVTSLAPGSLTSVSTNCLAIAFLAYRDTTTVTINDGFTILDQNPFISGTAVGSCLAYKILSSTGTVNPTFSWTNASDASAVTLLFGEPNSGGGGSAGGSYAFA